MYQGERAWKNDNLVRAQGRYSFNTQATNYRRLGMRRDVQSTINLGGGHMHHLQQILKKNTIKRF